jgi:single-stranded DNA-binding protein
MNECHFIGKLIDSPTINYHTQSNKTPIAVCHFTLGVSRQHKKRDGTIVNQTQHLDFEAWDSAAEALSKCRKGEWLIINRASARSEPMELGDGTKFTYTTFRVEKFSFQSSLLGYKI